MDCENCGHKFYNDGQQSDSIQVATDCPNCGYASQPSPIHSEMEMRNMPAPGEQDMGGNPLQEGILADGGWQNRMKRDESFASVRAAIKHADDWDDDDFDLDDLGPPDNPYQSEQPYINERFIVNPEGVYRPSASLLAEKGPDRVFHEDIAREHGLENFHTNSSLGTTYADGRVDFNAGHNSGLSSGHLAKIVAEHYPNHQFNPSDLGAGSQEERFLGFQPGAEGEQMLPDYLDRKREEADTVEQRGRPFGYYDNPYFNRGGSTRDKVFLPWNANTDRIATDFDIEQVVPPGPHSGEVEIDGENNPLILQHDNADVVDHAKQQLEASVKQAFLQALLMGARAVAPTLLSGLVRGALGGTPSQPAPAMAQPQQAMDPSMLSSVHRELLSAYEHPSSNPGFDDTDDPEDVDQHEFNDGDKDTLDDYDVNGEGGTDGIPMEGEVGQALEEAMPSLLRYFHSEESGADDPAIQKLIEVLERDHPGTLDHEPSPEDLDRIHKLHEPEPSAIGSGGKVGAAPLFPPCQACGEVAGFKNYPFARGYAECNRCKSLEKWTDLADQFNNLTLNHDLDIAGLPETDHPLGPQTGHVAYAPGIGGMMPGAMPAPGTQTLQSPVQNPGQQVAPHTQMSCPHCGARVTGGDGICPQCNGSVIPQANAAPATVAPPPTSPQSPMPQNMPFQAANQGPHNPEQFQAVAEYLKQQGQEHMIPDLIEHPENYGDILAEIQGKQEPPNPDPDMGPQMAPPPVDPAAMGMDPSQMGMMPTGSTHTAVDGIAPQCPKCDSHSTETLVSDLDPGNFLCHNCGHNWKRNDVVPTTSRTAFDHDQLHPHVMDVPAADQQAPDDPAADVNPGGAWQTQDGQPIKVGEEYEMYSAKYDVPDIVRIEAIKPDSIEYTLTGEYGLEHRTEISKQEANLDGLIFMPMDGAQDDVAPPEEEQAVYNDQGPGDQTDLSAAPGGSHDYKMMAKMAGKKFTPMEQREFIDEPGKARNHDKLDLEGTHYESRQTGLSIDDFLFGL